MGHVLYVDDDAELLRLGAATLTAHGHTVVTAGDAAEAMDYCEDQARPLSAGVVHLHRSFIGAGIALAGRIARERPDAAVTAYSGGIRSLSSDMPLNVRLLPKPLSVLRFHEAAAETIHSVRLHPCRSW